MKVTEQEFKQAFKIVNDYIKQLNEEITKKEMLISNLSKTTIIDWIEEQKSKTNIVKKSNYTRLFNVLKCLHDTNGNKIEYIEDVKKIDISKYKNSSEKIQTLFYKMIYNKL